MTFVLMSELHVLLCQIHMIVPINLYCINIMRFELTGIKNPRVV